MGSLSSGLHHKACLDVAHALQDLTALQVKLALVVGGGNIFRGTLADQFGFPRAAADQIGMLSTAINGIVLQQCLAQLGLDSIVMSAFPCGALVEPYCWKRARVLINSGTIVIFVGGTGNPYFTTDTAAALRACEMEMDILLKATKVDGIYSDDPKKNPHALRYEKLTYSEALAKKLAFMDATALALCRDHAIPVFVFDFFKERSLVRAICEQHGGSLVSEG